jgi:uncharacterized membrane protein
MNNFSDQALAKRLLERKDTGYSVSLYLRENNKSYSIFFFYCILLLVGFGLLQLWIPLRLSPFWVVVICVVACLSRDLNWIRATARAWQFTSKMIDWDKVQKLAEEKSTGQ